MAKKGNKGSGTFKIGRDARTGKFISVEKARRSPRTTVVERIPKPGTNDTGPRKK